MDKLLTAKNWKSFCSSGKRNYKDDKFVSALADAEKSANDPTALLDVLDRLDTQADNLLKANKGDKDLDKFFKDFGSALDRARKEATADAKKAAKEAAKAAESESDEGEEDEDPAEMLLTAKTKAGLKLARGGQPTPALISVAGGNAAVLVSNKPVGASQKKSLAKHLGGSGVKHFVGECVLEGSTYVFILEATVGGLAKRITKALKEQLNLKYKVTVRAGGEDETDGEMDPELMAELGMPSDAPEAASAADSGDEGEAPPAAPPDGAALQQLMGRLRALTPALQGPDLDDDRRAQLRTLLQQAGAALQGKDLDAAGSALDDAEDLLAQPPAGDDAQASADGGDDAATAEDEAPEADAGDATEATSAADDGDATEAAGAADDSDAAEAAGAAGDGDATEADSAAGDDATQAAGAADSGDTAEAAGADEGDETEAAQDDTAAATAETVKATLKEAMPHIRGAVDAGALPPAMLQQVVGKVNDLVGKKQFGDAGKLINALVGNAKRGVEAQGRAHQGIDSAVQAWDGLRGQIDQHLQALKSAAFQAVKEHNADPAAPNTFDEAQVQSGLEKVNSVMDKLDTRLNDVLHACRNKPATERSQLAQEVEKVIADYESYIQSDALFTAIDRSGFIDTPLHGVVSGVLNQVRSHLESVRG